MGYQENASLNVQDVGSRKSKGLSIESMSRYNLPRTDSCASFTVFCRAATSFAWLSSAAAFCLMMQSTVSSSSVTLLLCSAAWKWETLPLNIMSESGIHNQLRFDARRADSNVTSTMDRIITSSGPGVASKK